MTASKLDSRANSPVSPPAEGRATHNGGAGATRMFRPHDRLPLIIAAVGKGGAGKSTTTINLAVITNRKGLKVAIVDADPQRSTGSWRRARATSDIPVRCCHPDQLETVLNIAGREGFEYVFVDMPPDPKFAINAILAADFVLIPTRPTFFDLMETRRYIELLASTDRPHGVIINAAPPLRQGEDAPMVRDARLALARMTTRLWRRQITQRHAIPYAITAGRAVVEIEPEGPAAAEFGALSNAITQELKTRRKTA